jgi:restriction system protein
MPGAKAKHERSVRNAEESYQEALKDRTERLAIRKRRLEERQAIYQAEKSEFEAKKQQQNEQIDAFEIAYKNGDAEAIVAYNTAALQRSTYPSGFPQNFRVGYSPSSKELVVERELPGVQIIPGITEFRYVKARDAIDSKPRKQTEIRSLYQDLVGSIALRTIHEVFQTKQNDQINLVTFNGYLETTDPTTGQDIRPHLISVRVTRERFSEINLKRIEKAACLRNLGANASSRPDECLPIKPIVEFNMVDKRFVDSNDLLIGLESRPNLMDLNPFEFEQLVGNLFSKMNLETKQTRTSRDGGVDVVAFDTRPVLGGKVVIQAKRYRHTVGVSAVRDLYGTMMNEGANKGILVTTSGYGSDAFDFAKNKPIELIDGSGLLYLLEHHAGMRARIIMPVEP